MKLISVNTSKNRNRIDKSINLNINMTGFHDTFQNYFVDVFSILNVLNFKLHSSELSDVQMINDNNASAAAVIKNSELTINIMKLTAISVSDNIKVTSVKQITD